MKKARPGPGPARALKEKVSCRECAAAVNAGAVRRVHRAFGQAGFSLVELTVALFLVMTIAVFGLQTIVSGWMLQNWSIAQSMTDAYASIETANAQRWVFARITDPISAGGRWPVLPASTSTQITLGVSPHGPVTGTVIRTRQPTVVDPVTGATSYLLESYVIYQNGPRKYCKVSKVYRDQ